MNKTAFKKHKCSNSSIEEKKLKKPDHISLLDTWKENADFILNWADNVLIQNDNPETTVY